MSYKGMTGSALSEMMRDQMEEAVEKTANFIEKRAKRYAPVRKVFREKGAARMETRTFIDEGLPAGLGGKKGRKARVVTTTVRSHRANRMSTSEKLRQSFVEVSARSAIEVRRNASGEAEYFAKPGVIVEIGRYEKGEKPRMKFYRMSAKARSRLSSRGQYELNQATKMYQASVNEGENVTPQAITITEPYHPGKIGGYPRGVKLDTKTNTVTFPRVVNRQTVIRVKNTASIRKIVNAAARAGKPPKLPKWTGPEHYWTTPTKAHPKPILRVKAAPGKGLHTATPSEAEKWAKYQKKVAAAIEASKSKDRTFGGLNDRRFAQQMTPFEPPFGSFKGPRFRTHFNLQLGGHLRDSIIATPEGLKATVGTNVYYAIYQEYGTSHHQKQPFMRPALYDGRAFLLRASKEKASKAFSQIRGG